MYVEQNNQKGFTLIEMAISMMIVGILMAGAVQAYSIYSEREKRTKTLVAVQNFNQALQTFKNANGRYPCPAPIKEPRNSINYGHEVNCSGAAGGPTTPPITAPANFNFDSSFYRGGIRVVATSSAAEIAKWRAVPGVTEDASANFIWWIFGTPVTHPKTCTYYTVWNSLFCDYAALDSLINTANVAAAAATTGGDPARTLVAGQCLNGGSDPVNGICIEASARTDLATVPRVRVGGVPFRDLQMDEKDTFDGYGNRLVYAVTEGLANASTYKEREGGIRIIDSSGADISSGDKSAAYVVVSPGPNRNGAVNADGFVNACTGTGLETENCRDFTVNTNTAATYAMDVVANDFDDNVSYFVPNENSLWRRTDTQAEDVTDISEGRVGVGISDPTLITDNLTVGQSSVNYTTNPSDFGKLAVVNSNINHQTGSLRVGDGTAANNKLFANMYCDRNGLNCFQPENIVGNYGGQAWNVAGNGMGGCPAGEYMLGIEAGRAICGPVRFFCTVPGEVFVGFNGSNQPICQVPQPSCPASTGALCSTTPPLPASGNGVSVDLTYTVNGACAKISYICNSGTWAVKTSPPFDASFDASNHSAWRCNYNAGTPPTGSNSGLACPTGFSGTYTQNFQYNCDGSTLNTTSTQSSDCTCVGINDTEDYVCPANFGGSIVAYRSRTKSCTGNVLDTNFTYGGWFTSVGNLPIADPSTLCTCSKVDDWEFAACDTGMLRKASPSPASFTAPAESWPADGTFGKYRKITADTGTCLYNAAPAYDTSNCICDPSATRFDERNPTCSSCQETATKDRIRQIRSGAGCGWVDDPDTSGNTAGTCKAKTFIWKSDNALASTATLGEGRGSSIDPNTTCSCGEATTQTSCSTKTTTSWLFYTCTCTYVP